MSDGGWNLTTNDTKKQVGGDLNQQPSQVIRALYNLKLKTRGGSGGVVRGQGLLVGLICTNSPQITSLALN